jgi:hypothetical protein
MGMSAQYSSDELKRWKYKKVWDYYKYVCENIEADVTMISLEEYMERVPEYQVDELIKYFKLK